MCQSWGQPDIWFTVKGTHKSQPDSKRWGRERDQYHTAVDSVTWEYFEAIFFFLFRNTFAKLMTDYFHNIPTKLKGGFPETLLRENAVLHIKSDSAFVKMDHKNLSVNIIYINIVLVHVLPLRINRPTHYHICKFKVSPVTWNKYKIFWLYEHIFLLQVSNKSDFRLVLHWLTSREHTAG